MRILRINRLSLMKLNKRNIAAWLLCRYYIMTGRLRQVKSRAARGEILLSVYFHDPSRKQFEFVVRWFLKNGFRIISLEELESAALAGKPLPPSSVVLTVDDGWRNNIDNIAAVANQYEVPVTIFASTRPVETGEAYWWSVIAAAGKEGLTNKTVPGLKLVPNEERLAEVNRVRSQVSLQREAMTVEELTALSNTKYVHIGSHTVTHPILTRCNDATAEYEIAESGKILRDWLRKDIPYFAYPNGAFSDREIALLKKHGYRMAFSTEQAYVTPDNIKNIYAIPRFDILEEVSLTENLCRMTGIWFNR